MFFLASFTAFAIASTTSHDFQVPRPTLHFPSQTIITALNLNCLHHEVTLVTLSIASSSSLNSFSALKIGVFHFLKSFFPSVVINI
jgi:hypothetical protein